MYNTSEEDLSQERDQSMAAPQGTFRSALHGVRMVAYIAQLKCIEKMIATIEAAQSDVLSPDDIARFDAELDDLRRQRESILENPNCDGMFPNLEYVLVPIRHSHATVCCCL
jgi:hypothetical protein